MIELDPILYIFIGILAAGFIGTMALFLFKRFGLFADPGATQSERVDLISAAALEIMKTSLKEHDLQEEKMRREIVRLQAQLVYLQQTVDGLSRQLREMGRVPQIPEYPE